MIVSSKTEKKREKIKGKSLYEKYRYLYNQNPSRTHDDYMELLDINKGQAYTLKYQLKKELGTAYIDPSNVKDVHSVTESTLEVTSEPESSNYDLEELRTLTDDTTEVHNVSTNQISTDVWDNPFEDVQSNSQQLQQTVVPSPVFDISLSGVDSVTIQSFLRLISDRPKTNNKYTLELKLTEH